MTKTIHCCWLGDAPKTDLAKICMESWRKFAPEWNVREWTLDDVRRASDAGEIAPVPRFFEDAVMARKWAFAADWVRFAALHAEGGVYFDMDVELVAPFSADGEFASGEYALNGGTAVCACVLALEKGSPAAAAMLEHYRSERFETRRTVGERLEAVLASRGISLPVTPPDVFCPIDIDGTLRSTERTIGIHRCAMSWATNRRKFARWLSWHGMRGVVDGLLSLRRGLLSAAGRTVCRS